MTIQDLFSFLLSSTLEEKTTTLTSYYVSIFLLNLISYLYVCVKFFKIICYSRLTFEWLPMVNPYRWPFSMFNILTQDYFKFWRTVLPTIKFEKSSIEISAIIALEALNAVIYFCVRCVNILVIFLEEAEKGSIQGFF